MNASMFSDAQKAFILKQRRTTYPIRYQSLLTTARRGQLDRQKQQVDRLTDERTRATR